jgi:signal transduction histidine kinase
MSAELLTDDGAMAPEKRDKIARLILQSSKRLQRLIENYLLYAQLELVRSDAALTAALRSEQMREAGTLVQQIAGTVAAQHLRPDDLQLAIDVCDPLLALRGDDWRKIVYELVDNAFKFSVSGTPVLVRAGCEDGLYVLSVCDRGRGMTSAQTKQIGAYKQFDRRVYEQQGLGLGLAIACNLVDLHGGRLLVESTQGEGTCVQVHLTPTMFAARDPAAA